jgi:hypothetical protein
MTTAGSASRLRQDAAGVEKGRVIGDHIPSSLPVAAKSGQELPCAFAPLHKSSRGNPDRRTRVAIEIDLSQTARRPRD